MKAATLASLIAITACTPTTDEHSKPERLQPRREVKPIVPQEDLPAGWHRVDFRTLTPPLAISAAIPEGRRVAMQTGTCRDRDGMLFATVEAEVTLDDGSAVLISPCQNLVGLSLTTLEAAKADYARAGQVTIKTTEQAPSGEWAITLEGGFTVGWAPAAHMVCRAQFPKTTADIRRICLGLRPAGPGFVAAPDPALTFPDEPDRDAREVLASLQRALVRDDHEAFLALVDPNVQVRGGSVDLASRTALRIFAEGASLESYFELADCGPRPGRHEPGAACLLRSGRGEGRIGVTAQLPTRATWTSFQLAKTSAGWRIVAISIGRTS